ncbi:sugar transferase [Rhizobium ruizarguesonis]|jgi:lipopolysaccharide/colanic/teichoic acid biosynthesis glycosyltransferase|uniref:sugar transferase n=1 Tax=Rhizobium ruizarguesonis TaxID=2081791 RepID=UPI001030F5BF|nr:sugar transferase [Rhizobium ruizarguesonis]TBA80352.1 sugar transferase [Rhizobium ruizarguesonis]
MSFDVEWAADYGSESLNKEARAKRPNKPYDPFFGFSVRVLIAIASIIFPLAPIGLWGLLNGWDLSTGMISVYGFSIGVTVLVGEHFRSRIFERELRSIAPSSGHEQVSEAPEVSVQISANSGLNSGWNRATKRAFDIAAAVGALGLLWPLFIIVACFIKLFDGGPIFVRPLRYDLLGRPVRVLKFKTNVADDRVTVVGAFLRRSSVDELPQLLDVLLGSLSLIGPRPSPLTNGLKIDVSPFLKPGITDPAIGPDESLITNSEEYIHRLNSYASRWSFLRDFRILWRDVVATVRMIGRI